MMMQVEYKSSAVVNERDVADLICTAFEGGIGYWCKIVGYKKPEKVWTWNSDDAHVYRYVQYPMSEGGAVILKDVEGEDDAELTLDMAAIRHGLSVMASKYPRRWTDFVDDNADAFTGDVFIQCCLFGEVIYG